MPIRRLLKIGPVKVAEAAHLGVSFTAVERFAEPEFAPFGLRRTDFFLDDRILASVTVRYTLASCPRRPDR
jgi:hypothetical protein